MTQTTHRVRRDYVDAPTGQVHYRIAGEGAEREKFPPLLSQSLVTSTSTIGMSKKPE